MNPKLNQLNGIFLIHKEIGVTSHDVVFSLRKIIKDKQVGHIGTLDPLADGLLVCLVGEAVKLSDYLMGSDKRYRLTLKLGLVTDTWDITGKVVHTFEKTVTEAVLRKAILDFTGERLLPIPMYSAKKVNGQKLYDIVRGDEAIQNFEGPLKGMIFRDLKIVSIRGSTATVEFWCSKGSFVRSWIYCLGKNLGTGATMTELRRLDIGNYSLEKALTLDQLRKEIQTVDVATKLYFLTPWQALQGYKILQLDAGEAGKLRSGLVSYVLSDKISKLNYHGDLFCFQDTQLVGILNLAEKVSVRRIFVNS
jgi:tRNA pseudouridine55 synthase